MLTRIVISLSLVFWTLAAKRSKFRPALAKKQKAKLTALQAKIKATNSGRR